MEVCNWRNIEEAKVEDIPYRGKMNEVKGIGIRWLSKVVREKDGQSEYGLRLFTVKPGAEIPIHSTKG